MEKNRLEAFSDGVLAIVITIMVLELKEPEGGHFSDLKSLWPIMGSYFLSFLFVATFWVNHHMLFLKVERINLKILWCNIAWLFVMSLIPFTTAWVGAYPTSGTPLSLYFVDMALGAFTFHLMYKMIAVEQGQEVPKQQSIRNIVSLAIYLLVSVLASFCPLAAFILIAVVTCWWIVPINKKKKQQKQS